MTPWARRLRWTGVAAIMVAALIRAMGVPVELPWWDIDPLAGPLAEPGLLPSTRLTLDALVWIGVAAIVIAERLAGRRLGWITFALLAAGWQATMIHGWGLTPGDLPWEEEYDRPGDFAHLLTGAGWASALAGAWALAHAARDRAVRRAGLLILLAFGLVLIAKGLVQVLVELPALVERFESDPAAMLASQGMSPDSEAARIYERRLRSPDATGWFILSNVYGSVIAATLAASAAAFWAGLRRARSGEAQSGEAGVFALYGLAMIAGLWISHSKGAVGALILAAATVGAVRLLRHRPRTARLLPLAAIIAALAAIALRGAIGERIGELSLYFRWQYIIGALRAWTLDWFFGVGPADFKAAYQYVRVPTSPEEVMSPHAIAFDWLATLGVFGVAWITLLGAWAVRIGHNALDAFRPNDDPQPHTRRADLWIALAIFAVALAVAAWNEWASLTGTTLFALVIAAIVGAIVMGVAHGALRERDNLTRLALAAAAVVLLVHAQIETTLMMPGSAALAFAIIGLAAAYTSDAPRREPTISAIAITAIALAGSGLLLIKGVLPARAWEAALHDAAVRWRAVTSGDENPLIVLEETTDQLGVAATILPHAGPDLQAAALQTAVARQLLDSGRHDEARLLADDAAMRLRSMVIDRGLGSATVWARIAGAARLRGDAGGGEAAYVDAADAWNHVAELDPQAIVPQLRLYELHRMMWTEGLAIQPRVELIRARDAASQALERNDNFRLDPLKQLPDAQRRELEDFLNQRDAKDDREPAPDP